MRTDMRSLQRYSDCREEIAILHKAFPRNFQYNISHYSCISSTTGSSSQSNPGNMSPKSAPAKSSPVLEVDEEDDDEEPPPLLLIVHEDCVPPLLCVMTGVP